MAQATAERLGFSKVVQKSLDQSLERWDGKGNPRRLEGEAILLPARLAQIASRAVVFDRLGGVDAAIEMARRRRPRRYPERRLGEEGPHSRRRNGSRSGCIHITASAYFPALPCSLRWRRSWACIMSGGSGYHGQITAPSIPMPARVLAAADAYARWTEDRAHRAALSLSEAERRLASDAEEGRLDADAVAAVLTAAGHDRSRLIRRRLPAGLTDREVEVLRLIARGLSNRAAARRLFISPKTVGRHIENIYQKLEVSSRAGAALFAERHDLLRESPPIQTGKMG